MVLLGVNITTEFLRVILTGKIDIEANILFFIRIERKSNTISVISLLVMGVAATTFKNLYCAIVKPYNYSRIKKSLNGR